MAHFCYGDKETKGFLLVVTNDGPSLLGRDGLKQLKLDSWPSRPWSYLHIDLHGSSKASPGGNWCPLQAVGSSSSAYDYRTSYHSVCKSNFCPVWFTRKSCVWTMDQPLSAGNLTISCIRTGLSIWCMLRTIQLLMGWWKEQCVLSRRDEEVEERWYADKTSKILL